MGQFPVSRITGDVASDPKAALVCTPIRGTIEVTDRDLSLDVDLGLLNRLVPEKTAREIIGSRIERVLK